MQEIRISRSRFLRLSGTSLAGVGLLGVYGCGGGDKKAASLDEMDSVTLKVGNLYGPQSWEIEAIKDYTDAVEEASKGKIQFEHFFSESLVTADENITAMRDGVQQFGHVYPPYRPELMPISNWTANWNFLADPGLPAGQLQAASAQMEWGLNNEDIKKEYRENGIEPLLLSPNILMFDLLCNEPVTSLDDAEGKRVRVAGETWAAEAENLGMEPVSLAGGEVYEAFQRGIIDCAMVHPAAYIDMGLWEIASDHTAIPLTGWNQTALAMNKDQWDSLPVEAQRVMWDQLPVWIETLYSNYFEQVNLFVTDGQKQGINFAQPESDMVAKVEKYHEELLEEKLPDQAPEQIGDPEQVISERTELNDKWGKVLVDDLGYDAAGAGWADWVEKHPNGKVNLQPWLERLQDDLLEPNRP